MESNNKIQNDESLSISNLYTKFTTTCLMVCDIPPQTNPYSFQSAINATINDV